MVEDREGYAQRYGVDPGFAFPDANWAREPVGEFIRSYRRVAVCDEEAVGGLRAFSMIFSGYALYEVRLAHGVTGFSSLEPYTDKVIAERLIEGNGPYVERWSAMTADIPIDCWFRPPRRFGDIGHDMRGVIVNHDTVVYQERINLIHSSGLFEWLTRLAARNGGFNVLEIGGGYGALAYWFKTAFPHCSYTIVDLPESLLFSSLYLRLSRPDLAMGWGVDPVPYGVRFVPNYMAQRLQEPVSLVINTLSMSEMSRLQVDTYLSLMKAHWLSGEGFFFEQNQDNRHAGLLCAREIAAEFFPFGRNLGSASTGLLQGSANLWGFQPLLPSPQGEPAPR
ncbi:MAG: putative sugar O-methyltransferase [Alphaproteobacteria bacterium]|nr:putative sugar O-methyltransferase [Alphaproteobacteria bacterium]